MAVMTSSDFRSTVEPVINRIFDGVYNQFPEEWKEFLDTEPNPIQRRYHEEPVWYGLGYAQNKPEGEPFVYDEGGELYRARYFYQEYGLAFSVTRALRDDSEMMSVTNKMGKHLAISMRQTKEQIAATLLNNAFSSTYTGGDGVSLINTAHPYVGGTQSNQLTTAATLSEAAMEQLMIQIRLFYDGRGKPAEIKPVKLLVAPGNEYNAKRITGSILRSGTANNDINAMKALGRPSTDFAVITRISTASNWFIKTDAPEGMKYLPRVDMEKNSEGDFESDNMRYKAYMRFAMGWTDPLSIAGTAGF